MHDHRVRRRTSRCHARDLRCGEREGDNQPTIPMCRGHGCGASTRLALDYGGDDAVTRARDRDAAWYGAPTLAVRSMGRPLGGSVTPEHAAIAGVARTNIQRNSRMVVSWPWRVCVRRTECVAMAIADMPVLRQPNETSGSSVECDDSGPSDESILTLGTAFGKTLRQGRRCSIVSSGAEEIRTGRSASLQWRAARITQWSFGTKVRKSFARAWTRTAGACTRRSTNAWINPTQAPRNVRGRRSVNSVHLLSQVR